MVANGSGGVWLPESALPVVVETRVESPCPPDTAVGIAPWFKIPVRTLWGVAVLEMERAELVLLVHFVIETDGPGLTSRRGGGVRERRAA